MTKLAIFTPVIDRPEYELQATFDSLLKQTDTDFTWYVLLHPNVSEETVTRATNLVSTASSKFKAVLIHLNELTSLHAARLFLSNSSKEDYCMELPVGISLIPEAVSLIKPHIESDADAIYCDCAFYDVTSKSYLVVPESWPVSKYKTKDEEIIYKRFADPSLTVGMFTSPTSIPPLAAYKKTSVCPYHDFVYAFNSFGAYDPAISTTARLFAKNVVKLEAPIFVIHTPGHRQLKSQLAAIEHGLFESLHSRMTNIIHAWVSSEGKIMSHVGDLDIVHAMRESDAKVDFLVVDKLLSRFSYYESLHLVNMLIQLVNDGGILTFIEIGPGPKQFSPRRNSFWSFSSFEAFVDPSENMLQPENALKDRLVLIYAKSSREPQNSVFKTRVLSRVANDQKHSQFEIEVGFCVTRNLYFPELTKDAYL